MPRRSEIEWAAERFQILDHTPVGALVLRQDLSVLFWNSVLEEWTQIPREEIMGARLNQHFPHFNERKFKTRLKQVFEGGPATILSSQLHKHLLPAPLPNGELRIQETIVTAINRQNGAGYYALLSIQDVTQLSRRIRDHRRMRDRALQEVNEREKAELALREAQDELEERVIARTTELQAAIEAMNNEVNVRLRSERALATERERLATTLHSISDGVITVDTQGKLVLINRAAEELTGWRQKEAEGRAIGEVFQAVHDPSGEPVDIPLNSVVSEAKDVNPNQEIVLISRDGTRYPISPGASPLLDKDNNVIGMVLVFRDTTEKQRLEAEILRSQKLESLGVFAGGLAHDFNNFLATIMLNISTARMKTKDRPDLQKLLATAEGSIGRAASITRQLMTFTRGGEPVKTGIILTPLLKESVKFALHGSTVSPVFQLAPELWGVDVDTGQINQVINNLVINAVAAMPAGGHLTISARNVVVDAERPIGQLPRGRYMEVAIRDEGEGIPAEHLEKIFDPYFTTKETGTGLGLFSCYNILDKHGGWIRVASKVQEGSTFTFYLPAMAAGEVAAETSAEPERGSGRVLVMDDEKDIREGLSGLLGTLGYDVTAVPSGEEAVAMFGQNIGAGEPFNVVILDLTVPGGMGGVETSRRLHRLDPRVKAIVASGYANDPVMAHYSDYGFGAVISKPFNATQVSQALKGLLAED